MKVVLQRVLKSNLSIDGKLYSAINNGLMILVGICAEDNDEDIEWLTSKICGLRIFNDNEGVMNLSINDVAYEIMAVSQFTLMARVKKGNRPSYIDAAPPEISKPLYNKFVEALQLKLGREVKTGVFGADMQIELINDGPVTIIMDSKDKK